MKHGAYLRPRSAVLLVLALSVGCSLLGDRREPERPKAKIESLFLEPDHRLATCLHGDLALSYTSDPDSVLFYDKDSRIKVSPPTKKGAARYHAHILHRVGTSEILDFTFNQDSEGFIEIDLGRFDQPEEVVITSAARRITEDRPAAQDASAVLDRQEEELITPPYVLSFRLVPRDGQIETILPLNRHRYEIETELGTLYLMVSSFSKRDQLLTLIDPQRSLGPLLGEDPYVYLQGEDGAVPPRIMVEVLRPGSKVPWQKAATYHIPEAADRFTKPGDRPFVLRTSKRNLIAFGAAPRLDLELPKEPAQTTALVSASFTGVGEKDALKFVLASAYPSGKRGDYSTKVDSHIITASTRKDTYTCDLSHLDSSKFPLVASLVNRLVTPWKLTAGRWAPEPPRDKVSIPLVAPQASGVKFSRFLAPKYASHFDFLAFLGAGSGKRKGSSLLDPDFSGQPDDPNVAPPPPGGPPGPGNGIVPTPSPAPPAQSNPGGGFGVGGGQDSQCGCGKNGRNCPNTAAPCKGTCGQGCPGNGCCDAGNNIDGGAFLVTLPCPPKGKSCGKNPQDCDCPPHQWDRDTIQAAVQAAINANAFLRNRFADMDGPVNPIGFAPCHTPSFAANVVAHFWKNMGVGIGGPPLGQWNVTYHVNVNFTPCVGKPDPKPMGQFQPIKLNQIIGGQNSSGGQQLVVNQPTGTSGTSGTSGPLTGATFTLDVVDPTNSISTSRNATIDPNTMIDVAQATNALGVGTGTSVSGGLTNSLLAGVLHADIDTLLGVRSLMAARSDAMSSAWLMRPVMVLNGPDSWTMSLPSGEWAAYQQQGQQTPAGGGGSSSSSTPPTPPPSTSTTTKPSSAIKPGPRS